MSAFLNLENLDRRRLFGLADPPYAIGLDDAFYP